MASPTYGVDHNFVHDRYFSAQPSFSATSAPTLTAVGSIITDTAAEVTSYLAVKNINWSAIVADAGALYPVSWALLQRLVGLGAAYQVGRAMPGFNPETIKAWEGEYHGDSKISVNNTDPFPGGLLGYICRHPTALADAPPTTHPVESMLTSNDDLSITSLATPGNGVELDVSPRFTMDDKL